MKMNRGKMGGSLGLLAICLIVSANTVCGETYVTTDGTGNGTSWENATSLTNALTNAVDGGVIWVAQGTYNFSSCMYVMPSNLTIYGGFTNGMATLAERNSTNYVTILDGGGAHRVLEVTGTNVVVDGFTIQNGACAAGVGGGINNSGAGLKVANCRLVKNVGGSPDPGTGGAICSTKSLTVSNCVFEGNKPGNNRAEQGGGIYFNCAGGWLIVQNCDFNGNSASGDSAVRGRGAAIYVNQGNLVAVGSSFITNSPVTSGNYGGAIDLGGSSDPYSDNGVNVVSAWFTNCVFVGNFSATRGGAIYQRGIAGSTVTVVNCTFHTNRTSYANGSGSIYSYTPIIVKNSIFRDSTTPTAIGKDIYAVSNATISYSCFAGTDTNYIYAGNILTTNNLLVADPLFASPVVPYDMHERSTIGRYFNGSWVADMVDSPCIDSGDAGDLYSNEPLPNGDRVNMGAYGNTPEASKTMIVRFLNIGSTNITASSTDVSAMLTGSNSDCVVLYDTNNWGITFENWAHTNLIGAVTAGTTVTNNLPGLHSNHPYYFLFYGTNNAVGGTGFSSIGTFVTYDLPNINNGNGAIDVMAKAAVLTFTVVTSHMANVTVYYGTTDGGTTIGNWQLSTNLGVLSVGGGSVDVGGLLTNKVYYYRCYATNSVGDAWAPASTSFTTMAAADFTQWNKMMPITFSWYTKSEVLRNIPMLVVLSNNVDNSGFSYSDVVSTNGYDIRFTDDSGINELPYEVEKWDTNGASYFWVKVPALSNQNAAIRMYYNRVWQTNCPAYCTNTLVWTNGYRAVWHFNANELDSSPYEKNGSLFNNVTNANGLIAGCKGFNNSVSWIDVPEIATNMDKVTYSVWMKLPSMPDDLDSILDTDSWNANDMQLMFRNNGKVRLSVNGNTPTDAESTYAFGAGDWNQWRYVTVVYDRIAKTSVFYVNAVPGASNVYTTALAGSITAANIGSYNISRYLNGLVDEFSIAADARSSNWVWASFMNMASNTDFAVYGPVSNASAMVFSTPFAQNISTDSADIVTMLTGSNGNCIVVYDTNDWGYSLNNWQFTNIVGSVTGGTTITNNVTNLLSNTYYYYMFCATNTDVGVGRFSELTRFTTISMPIVNNDGGASNMTGIGAFFGYTMVTSHSANVTIYYGKTDGGTVQGNWQLSTNLWIIPDAGAYSAWISSLERGTVYYYRCYVTNNAGDTWAPATATFKTVGPLYVNKNAVGLNSGSSWADAYTTVSNALSNAVDSVDVWVASGIYTESMLRVFASNVCVYGGFTNGMASRSERDPTNNIAALDGAGSNNLFVITGSSNLVDGLRIQNGVATPAVTYGGGINNSSTGFVVANCMFVSNRINTSVANPNPARGGAIYSTKPMLVSNCVFNTNTIGGNQFSDGGAIYFEDAYTGVLTIANSSFNGNQSSGDSSWDRGKGSAIYTYQGKLLVIGSSFISNGLYGGAIDIGNLAWFTNCIFAGNKSGAYIPGSVIYQRGGTASTVTIVNCTFHTNYAPLATGGATVFSPLGPVIVKNSIFWHSITAVGQGKDLFVTNATVTYSCFASLSMTNIYSSGTLSMTNCLALDPLFAATNFPYDLHERSTVERYSNGTWVVDVQHSPCIDTGDPSDIYASEPAENGSRINMGAYGNTVQASKGIVAVAPVITNDMITVLYNEAMLSGGISAGTWSQVKIYYGTNDGGTTASNWAGVLTIGSPKQADDVFSSVAANLLPDTLYYFACYATNSTGDDWATPSMTFTSGPLPPSGGPTIIHVDKNAGGSVENGQNWYNAYRKLSTALAAASPATCEVWVAQGTYIDTAIPLAAVTNTAIYGGFTNGMTARSQRDWSNNVTTVDGNALHEGLQVTASNVVVDGLRFQNCIIAGLGAGAGIANSGNALTVVNCTFVSNRVNTAVANPNPAKGGGIYSSKSLTVQNCAFYTNTLSGNQFAQGGAIHFDCAGGWLVVRDCAFNGNKVSGDAAIRGKGSAIYVNQGSMVVAGSSFLTNGLNGGAVDLGGSTAGNADDGKNIVSAWFTNCVFAGNVGQTRGGAIYQRGTNGSTVTVVNCTFHTNSTSYANGAGGVYSLTAPVIVKNCIFRDSVTPTAIGKDVYAVSNATVSYSCFADLSTINIYSSGELSVSNCLTSDPLFAATNFPYDLHEKSAYGRWDPAVSNWVTDSVNSPCIDSGDTNDDYSYEPFPNGGLINMGAYGNTVQASKSEPEIQPTAEDGSSYVRYNAAIIRGKMTSGVRGRLTIYYGNNDGYTTASAWDNSYTVQVRDNDEVNLMIRNLQAMTLYYYRTYVTNSVGDDWSDSDPNSPYFATGENPPGANSDKIYVDCNATNGIYNDGSSWPFACLNLRSALSRLSDLSNEIWIAQGTYTDSVGALTLSRTNMLLYGGFTNGMLTLAERSPANYVTALDGGGIYTIMKVTGANVLVDGFRIQNGVATLTVTYGGGINNSGTGLVVANCTFVSNRINTAIANPNPAEGGALYSTAPMVVSNCVFNTNTISGNQFAWGGAIYFNSAVTGQMTIINSSFSGNQAQGDGGYRGKGSVIYVDRGRLVVLGSSFILNNPGKSANAGGAIDLGGASTTLDDWTGNIAYAWFTNCIFIGNYGAVRGGAIVHRATGGTNALTVYNCTFRTNTTTVANGGGAIHSAGAPLIVNNSIFIESVTPSAIGKDIYAASNATVTYSCFTGTDTNYIYLGSMSVSNNLLAADPLFAGTNDLHLKSKYGRWQNGVWVLDNGITSPCIDAGDPAIPYSNEPYPNGGRINMGAYGNTTQASKNAKPSSVLIIR